MVHNKRGISPIISTVLLIAFTITLFLLVSSWIRGNLIDESLSSTEEKLAGQLDCLSTTVELKSACVDNIANAANVQLNVDNTGDTSITGLTIRVLNADDLSSVEFTAPSPVPPLGRVLSKSDGNQVLSEAIANPTRIEVYPKISSGLCKDNVDFVTNILVC